ncbi:MAG: FAD synthetase family protein [Bacteroidales bacterium]|nr:FAD synthetase family protein [Bacteroidales bacterium]
MAVVATGFFDGVHLGHRKVIETLVREARRRGEESIVVTFAQHPRLVLGQDADALRILNSPEERISLIRSLGVNRVEMLDFTPEFASLKAVDYLRDIVMARYGGTAVVVGYNNRLGSDRLSSEGIMSVAGSLGLDVITCEAVDGVSSTRIRKALDEGRIDDAQKMAGHNI